MVRPVELEGMELRRSAKERDRLVVIRALDADRLSVRHAAEQLGLSARQVYRSLQRFRAQGDAGLVHRSRGWPSHRRLPAAIEQQAREALRDEDYADFGPGFAAQQMLERHDIKLSKETVRRLPAHVPAAVRPESRTEPVGETRGARASVEAPGPGRALRAQPHPDQADGKTEGRAGAE